MKFDVIVGNPPYQDEQPGGRTATSPIYPYFMDEAFKLAKKVSLITPARFLFNAGLTNKNWNEKMLNDEHLKVVKYEARSNQIFPKTDIKGGIVVTYRDMDKTYEPIKVFTISPILNSILKKVQGKSILFLESMIAPQVNYRFTKLMHEENPEVSKKFVKGAHHQVGTGVINAYDGMIFFDQKPNDHEEYIQILGLLHNKRVYKWIRKNYISENEGLYKYKVFVPKANGSGNFGEPLSSPLIGHPSIGHTQTFISIGQFNDEVEANNCLSYIKTKFARAMLGIMKVTQDNLRPTWKYVPLKNFKNNSDIDWNKSLEDIDKQLYKKYGLSEDEINFIEDKVKPME